VLLLEPWLGNNYKNLCCEKDMKYAKMRRAAAMDITMPSTAAILLKFGQEKIPPGALAVLFDSQSSKYSCV
jgi:hypothetical protein